MKMTPEVKAAFRTAYELMEKTPYPEGSTQDIAQIFMDMSEDIEKENSAGHKLASHLMMGVYWYLDDIAKAKK